MTLPAAGVLDAIDAAIAALPSTLDKPFRDGLVEARATIEAMVAALAGVDKVLCEFEGMTGAGYRYMAANVREAMKPLAAIKSAPA